MRALATSLAFFKQASMEQVIRAGTWVSSNTYLLLSEGLEFYSGEFIPYGTTGYCGNYYSVLIEPSIGKNFPPNCAIEF